jgi:phage repressor protein C with HTH and peptisase S24 domain
MPPQPGVSHLVSHPANDDVLIPQFETGGKMGDGLVLRDQPGLIHSWNVSPEWVRLNVRHHTGAKNLCIVTGFGDSMRPMFNPGDPLLVDRGVTTMEGDAVYFFGVEGEGFIKRLQRVPGQGIVAISENKAYRDWIITRDMNLAIFGRVVKVWRGEEF